MYQISAQHRRPRWTKAPERDGCSGFPSSAGRHFVVEMDEIHHPTPKENIGWVGLEQYSAAPVGGLCGQGALQAAPGGACRPVMRPASQRGPSPPAARKEVRRKGNRFRLNLKPFRDDRYGFSSMEQPELTVFCTNPGPNGVGFRLVPQIKFCRAGTNESLNWRRALGFLTRGFGSNCTRRLRGSRPGPDFHQPPAEQVERAAWRPIPT